MSRRGAIIKKSDKETQIMADTTYYSIGPKDKVYLLDNKHIRIEWENNKIFDIINFSGKLNGYTIDEYFENNKKKI